MLSLFSALTYKAYLLIVIGLCSLFGFKVFAQEITISTSTNNYVKISKENAQYFYTKMSQRVRGASDEKFWNEVSDYFRRLPKIVEENAGNSYLLNDYLFPMEYPVATRIVVKNEDLIRSDLLAADTIKEHTIDRILLRDSVVIVADYYSAIMGKELNPFSLLKTLGVTEFKDDERYPTIGQTVHPFDVNEKNLGNQFINNHPNAKDWVQFLGNVTLKDALDLAYSEELTNQRRHPLLGGQRVDLYKYFQVASPIISNIFNFYSHVTNDALGSFSVMGHMNSGEALSIYLCHHHLKADQVVTSEFKAYCDYVLYRASYKNKLHQHSMQTALKGLNSRYNLHF